MARAQHAVLSTVVVIIQKLHNEGLHFQGRTMQSPTILLELIYFTGDINENIEPQLLFQHGLLNR